LQADFAHAASLEGLTRESADPSTIWRILFAGLVISLFFTAVILWVMSFERKLRRIYRHNTAFIYSSLNNLSQGVVMVNGKGEVAFCNDFYLQLYGLTRADVFAGMTNQQLVKMRESRGVLGCSATEYMNFVRASESHFVELPDGRSILVKHYQLPNGGSISLHEDCTEQRRLSRQLSSVNRFLESVIDNIPVCVAAKSTKDGRYTLVNRAFEAFVGRPRDEMIGRRTDELFASASVEAVNRADREALESPSGSTVSEFFVTLNGQQRLLSSNRVVVRCEGGRPEFLIALFEDITDRRELSNELEQAKKFLELVVDNIPVALSVTSVSDNRHVLINRNAEAILQCRREDVIGAPAEGSAALVARDAEAVRSGAVLAEEHPIETKDGLRLFRTRRVAVNGDNGEPLYLIKTHEDVTQRRATEARMAHMAYHDSLTDLPNRASFLQSLTQMIDACNGSGDAFAVLSIDLDRFKDVNDVFGHETGDSLIVEVAQRIRAIARGAVVARLSGDEFGIIVDGPQPAAAKALAAQLVEAMRNEFDIRGKSLRIGMTVGISIFPHNGADAATLLATADAALFRAKDKARGSVSLFAADMDQQIRSRRALHQDLAAAILNEELHLHYQPQVILGDSSHHVVAGFEVLARWTHPHRGVVPPSEFIPLAEESGLIVELGEYILRRACREATSWPEPLQIAVNLSPAQFLHGDVVGLVHSILLETGLKPGRLELEITEGVLIDDLERGLSLLRRLKALGVRIAMDDFGSGYSSLTYLQAFPFDKIKIDRTFVINLGRNPQSATILRAVIALGHGLEIPIIAEGVETREQLDFLAREGCDLAQGYLIGRPGPIEQYDELVGRPMAIRAVS
jgi:diguanylate cyclase (GGDEF)-like protein/PAS domain S-box-containing protein